MSYFLLLLVNISFYSPPYYVLYVSGDVYLTLGYSSSTPPTIVLTGTGVLDGSLSGNIEINTSGERKSGENHPSLWILKEACKLKIPITIGADSHYPEQIDYGIEKAIATAKKAGYTTILKFINRNKREITLKNF